MEKFLERVAADLWERYGERVGELKVLLPNVRTRVFFVDALSRIAGHPIWSPEFISIDSLMVQLSGLERVDSIVAITELFKIYSQEHTEETFDTFYRWGEVLLGDYDAIDKYRIDARMLFANIADLKDVDADLEKYLSADQLQMVRRFWREFGQGTRHSEHKERFLSIWRTLFPIYEKFRARLEELGVGYTGMIYRRATELLEEHKVELPEGRYAVVGFNALSDSEKVLFDRLRIAHEADFYWDWDDYYLLNEEQEAGLFVRQNIKRYPVPATFHLESSFAKPKDMRVISTASNSLQCKYVGEFIREIAKQVGAVDRNTAIVLTDEGLLSPLLYSLPEAAENINITMGYPLSSTLAYSFVDRLLGLQLRARRNRAGVISFYHSDVEGLLSHPFVVGLDRSGCVTLKGDVVKRGKIYVPAEQLHAVHPLVTAIFSHHDSWTTLKDYVLEVIGGVAKVEVAHTSREQRALTRECFGLISDALIKTDGSLARCGVEMKPTTYVALVRRILQGLRIPYSGEPLSGVQVMGILETRNLDFDNVLLLSMNDDNFPSARLADISFIPYNLRFAYGMPTPRDNEGVYAYYFYRLVSRARRVDMVYCSVPNEKATGEQSRYIYQLDYESPHELTRIDKGLNVSLADNVYHTVAKRGDVLSRLNEFRTNGEERPKRTLSPSALNNYILCPLKFYFSSIAGIRTEEEIEEGVDNALFGTIFHKAMENLYTKPKEERIPLGEYIPTLSTEDIHKAVVDAISSEFYGEEVPEAEYGGNLLIVRDTVEKYINGCVLPFDSNSERGDFRVCGLEERIEGEFDFGEGRVRFGGIADRLDIFPDGTLRIIDYKTGALHNEFGSLADIFAPEGKELYGPVVQTLLYAMLAEGLQREGKMEGRRALPALYFVRHMGGKSEYSPLLNHKKVGLVENFGDYAEEYGERLAELLRGLFDADKPFEATQEESRCVFCDFAKICLKG